MKLSRRDLRLLIERTLDDSRGKASLAIGRLKTAAIEGKLKPDYISARDELIQLKEERNVKELKDFDKKLAGAYYFAKNGIEDEKLKEKFNMTGKEAIDKMEKIIDDLTPKVD